MDILGAALRCTGAVAFGARTHTEKIDTGWVETVALHWLTAGWGQSSGDCSL
jgi:hypothetical protein